MTIKLSNKKICLIKPGCKELLNDKMDIPYGLLCLGSAVQAKGYEVNITDLSGNEKYEIIPEADVYCISALSVTYEECCKIRNWLRHNYPNRPIILGGAHATIEYENIINDDFDVIFTGEGEITFPSIIDKVIKGYSEKIIHGVRVENLDDFELDYSLIDLDTYERSNNEKKSVSIMSSRGCLFRCYYCWNNNQSGKMRYRSVNSMKKELILLHNKYGVEHICFMDDSFLSNTNRAIGIMEILYDLNMTWEAECNIIHMQNIELCKKMKKYGCTNVFFGLESGCDRMLKAMNKPQTKALIRTGVNNLHKSCITVRGSIMVGYPGETWESINETIDFVKEISLDEYSLYTFIPYPGTDPYKNPKKYGIEFLDKNYNNFFLVKGNSESSYCFKTNDLTPELIKKMREYMKDSLNNLQRADIANKNRYTKKQ